MRIALIALMILASFTMAHAMGLGKLGFQFGHFGSPGGKKAAPPAVPCSGTGLIFNVACNSQYVGII